MNDQATNDPTTLADLSAAELLTGYRSGKWSPVEVTDAVLDRVDRLEPTLHALYAADPERARAAARASEQRWRAGRALPLDGVPVTLKENIATEGTPVPLGSAATELVPATEDAPAAARLRAAGAVLLAKTTMPDYGMLTSGLSSFHPTTRNPWDTTRTPGGSSSGAAAAAAAGYGPLHVGVGDAALLTGVLSAPDPRDHLSLPPVDLPWEDLTGPVGGMRIGVHLDAGVGLAVDPEIGDAVLAAARALEAAGAVLERVEPFLTREMLDGLDTFWRVRAWSDLEALPEQRRSAVLPYILRWAERGAHLSGVQAYRGFTQIDAMGVAAVRAGEPYDFVLSPTCPVPPPPADWASPRNDAAHPFEHIGFTLPYNMSGQPAVSVPCGMTSSGLPIGLQISGRRFDDLGVLRLAAAFTAIHPPDRLVPDTGR